jgi:hypothetical protein
MGQTSLPHNGRTFPSSDEPQTGVNPQHNNPINFTYLDYRREFYISNPPTFDGTADPTKADTWLYTIEEEFNKLEVPDGHRVNLAAGLLIDRACRWWRTAKNFHGEDAKVWNNFRTHFLDEYVTQVHREEKCRELDRLQQGEMTVQEYREKFEDLCLYREAFFTHPREKIRKFIDGLKWEYQTHLSVRDYPNYKSVAEAALRLVSRVRFNESLRLGTEGQNSLKPSRKRRNDSHDSNPHDEVATTHKKLRPEQSLDQVTSSRTTSSRVLVCYRCRETGHKLRDCPYKPKAGNSQGSRHYFREQQHGSKVSSDPPRPSSSHPSQTRVSSNSQSGRATAMVRYAHLPNRT